MSATHAATRDWWVVLGLSVSALAAAVSSFAGLHALALVTDWHPWVAPLFPLTVDAFAATATRVWLTGATSTDRARRFARLCAVGAISMSLAGNAVWHLIAAGLLSVGWVVVLAVGAVPPVVLGLVAHLAVLRGESDPAVRQPVPSAVSEPGGGTRYATEDELLAAAQAAEAAWRREHGRPIPRDALRKVLRVSATRATAVLRRLRAESQTASAAEAGGARGPTKRHNR